MRFIAALIMVGIRLPVRKTKMAFIALRQVGNILHAYSYERDPSPKRKKTERYPYPRISPKRRSSSIERASRSFRELVASNLQGHPPALLTLTYEGLISIDVGYPDFTAFFVRMRFVFGKDLRFLAVPEFQKRGSVHFHCLVFGLPDLLITKGYWGRLRRKKVWVHSCLPDDPLCGCERKTRQIAKIWGHGFVDIIPTDGSPKLAGYLSKYMTKAMHDPRLAGRKAYTSSRNINRPVKVSTYRNPVAVDLLLDMYGINIHNPLDQALAIKEHIFNTAFMGRCHYKKFSYKGYE